MLTIVYMDVFMLANEIKIDHNSNFHTVILGAKLD